MAVSADPYYGYGQYSWPSAYGYGFSSTCYGCRGKRSAEPSAEPEPYYGYPYFGLYGPGVAGHPTGISYTQRSPQGIGKRSADPEPYYGYGFYGYGPGIAHHGYGATSYTHRSPQGIGKRSADPEPYYGYGGYGYHGYGGRSYVGRTIWGLGK